MDDVPKIQVPQNSLSTGSVPSVPVSTDLKALAAGIYECHEDASRAWHRCVARAMEAGDLLKQAKDIAGHGNFMRWLKDDCKIPARSAERYMQLADNRKTIEEQMKSAAVANLTLRQAERLIAKSSNGQSSPSGEPAKIIGGNDAQDAVTTARENLLAKLKTLRRNDERKAKDAASAVVRRLEEMDLVSQ
jgi:hypothetical protein